MERENQRNDRVLNTAQVNTFPYFFCTVVCIHASGVDGFIFLFSLLPLISLMTIKIDPKN